jgi:DNA repair exonuclease SbcCD nuclease subunit
MSKFAHMADIHLGAHREHVLQEIEMKVFNAAMDKCVELGVDFILVSGDFFHLGVPDLGVVNEALKKIREVQEAGIPIYVIYGSHDYTPTGTSVIDLLHTAGMVTKVVNWRMEDGKLKLDFFEDPKTGAKLVGISARKIGLESRYYEILDKESLEKEDGFKIFAFHSGLTEFKPTILSDMQTVPISNFPKGFDYYAGGHIHERGEFKLPGYQRVVFPGPLFTGHGRDIEATAKGEERGFYLVTFDEEVTKVDFVPIHGFDGVWFEYDADGKNSVMAGRELQEELDEVQVREKIVVLKVKGELSGGKPSDIDFAGIRAKLLERGAISVFLNRHGITSREYAAIKIAGDDPPAIESKLFGENIGTVRVAQETLKGDKGVSVAIELLKTLRQEPKGNESKAEYLERMVDGGIETLRLRKMLEGA